MSGLGIRSGEIVLNPYLGECFEICAVTTDYSLAVDEPLEPRSARPALADTCEGGSRVRSYAIFQFALVV